MRRRARAFRQEKIDRCSRLAALAALLAVVLVTAAGCVTGVSLIGSPFIVIGGAAGALVGLLLGLGIAFVILDLAVAKRHGRPSASVRQGIGRHQGDLRADAASTGARAAVDS